MIKNRKPTLTQRLIWLDQSISSPHKYNIGGYVTLRGNLDLERFKAAIKKILISQEVYSAIFKKINGGVCYELGDASEDFALNVIDFSNDLSPEESALSVMKQDFATPFDVEGSYLFKFLFFRLSANRFIWYSKMHHLIADGWTFMLLLNEVASFYNSDDQPDHFRFRYSDYALKEENYHASDKFKQDQEFWENEFRTIPEGLFEKSLHNNKTGLPSKVFTMPVSEEVKNQLIQFSISHKVSLFHIVIGLFLVYFCRTRGKEAITFALPISNRSNRQYKNTAGAFMNLICLPLTPDLSQSMLDTISWVKKKVLRALKHQQYQFGNLVMDLGVGSHAPLYHLRVSYEHFEFSQKLGDVESKAFALGNKAENDPLSVYIRDYNDDGLDIKFVYNSEYLAEDDIRSASSGISVLIDELLTENARPCKEVQLIDHEEYLTIDRFCKGPVIEWNDDHFIPLWQKTVETYPNRLVVSTANHAFTYAEVNNQALKLASYLSESVKKESVVGLVLPRNEMMVIGMIGCMMSKVTYTPVEPGNPAQRSERFFKNIGCDLLIVSKATRVQVETVRSVNLEDIVAGQTEAPELPQVQYDPEDTCYILHTSGSTGNPKGVAVSHKAVGNYIQYFKSFFSLMPDDVVLQQASVSFDTSVEEIFPILITGGRVHILEERRDVQLMQKTIEEEKVTILSTTPLVLKMLGDKPDFSSLRTVISGGDVLQPDHFKGYLQNGVDVYNTYGPTEATVCCTYHKVVPAGSTIPIGRPVANTSVYILDKYMNWQPIGIEGDIYIGGVGLAKGYINNPDATRASFVENPFQPGTELYKTGDIGKLNSVGEIEYTGRSDDQLKIRGMRVDVNEITDAIKSYDSVEEVVIDHTHEAEKKALVCYYTLINKRSLDIEVLREFLELHLPEHMIPSYYIEVYDIPLTIQGKTDRRKLRKHYLKNTVAESGTRHQPSTKNEQLIKDIWEEFIHMKDISTTDNFFHIGGNSLVATMVLNKINEVLELDVSLNQFYSHPTIKGLAQFITQYEDQHFEYIDLD
ncbi:amino acid adenylation domain-containing protein [Fulvivirga sp. 29W222]|uniref:Amino acid adenylation domain-containing protein n=1 Tax=Fulvivirga marina TaxID=2494733 RepID=A0A937KE97_9BACT|nr:non-ribosomal peptide synthetase [Fulvivirga marina]MBL6449344.1 amino acid adenylation domain-containing protein [Fulvivirga marina]